MRYIKIAFLIFITISCFQAKAQVVNNPMFGNQQQTEVTEESKPKLKPKQDRNYIRGLRGLDSLSINRVFVASALLPGYGQAYNKQYWKLPVLYGGMGAFIYGGAHTHSQYKKTGDNKYLNQSRLFYAGAGLMYVGSVVDALSNYKSTREVIPAKATLLSLVLPGAGQAYNGDYWKIPIIYTGFAFLGYWYDLNQMNYKRYKRAYNIEYANEQKISNEVSEFHGRFTSNSIKAFRNNARRNRDYAVLYLVLLYGVNIVEANVSAHLSTFDVSENLALRVSPAVIQNDTKFTNNPLDMGVGLTLTFNFKK